VQITREQELGIDKSKKKVDIREEYFVRTFSKDVYALLYLALP